MCNRHEQNDKSTTLNLFIFAVKTLHLSLENIIDIWLYFLTTSYHKNAYDDLLSLVYNRFI